MEAASIEARPARRRRPGSLLLLAAVACTSCAPSSAEQPQHEPPPRLRRTNANDRPRQRERSLSAAYCGGNWQDAHDSCDRPCTSGKDEECGPGLYCFSYIDCTPPGSNSGGEGGGSDVVPPQFGEPPANVPHPAPNQNNPAPSPNYGAWGGYPSEDHGAPILPPSEYMPTYIASLPVRPSDPHRTPAPFVLPKPTPNQKSNPSKNFCGYGWESANDECFHACPSGESKECPGGKTCHSWLTCAPATVDPATFNVCGKNWAHAAATCATRCFLGDDDACPDGESCFGGVAECGDQLPPLTAEDVGLAEKTYTEEEIKTLLDEEIANERDEEAMSNQANWWCGTSWSNMLETCSQRCTSDADCKPNAWTNGQCFKTTGGPDNCSTPGVPVKDPVPDNARWCGSTWNDMLETCDKKCGADEDCGHGRRCWEAPDTCQWIGVPVKEKTQVETLWCGSDYDDAMTGCHRACPGESDDECPSGMSCFSGSSCTTEGVAVVREGYRCGATWEEASQQCGKECQKDDECDVGAGQLCFSDVVCESELLASQSSGMFCGTTWEGTSRACHARCEVDEDCPGNQWCYWVECANANAGGASSNSMQEPKTQPTQASCNAEVKRCPNGQYVARAPQLNCEFHACPGGDDAGGGGGSSAGGGSDAGGSSAGGGSGGGSPSAGGGNVAANGATSDVDLSGWGSTPLAHICTADTPGDCGLCEGDCNQDSDCVTGLLCFSRAQGESTTVPGCVSGGEGDKPGMDYCYSPFPPATTTTTTTTTTPIAVVADWDPASVADLDYTRECTSDNPCGACQGDCDVDSHCADNLACYSRGIGGVDPVPGCTGLGVAGMDYCHDPHAPIVGPPTPSPQAASCSAEVRVCRDGSFVYQDPENDCLFPPCPIPGAADAAAEPAPTPAEPSPTPPPTASSPQFDALAAFCGYSVAQVNSNCDDATPCPSGKDDECDGMEVCVLNTNCGQTATATTGTEEPLSEEDKCNSLCVDVLPSEWCPEETSDLNLPSCLDVGVGELCEADGECDTSDALNNCGTYDIYARVQCGEATASQGQLMRGTTAPTSGPTRPPIPLPTASPVTSKPTASPTQSLRPTSGASQLASLAASAANMTSSEPVTIADAIAIATANSQQGQTPQEGNATNATAPTAYDPNPLGGNYDRNPAGGDATAYADAADGPSGGWEYEAYQPPPSNAAEEDDGAQPPWDFGSYFTPNRNAATVVSTRRCFIVSIGMAVAVGIAIG